jgi:hypothetical protein
MANELWNINPCMEILVNSVYGNCVVDHSIKAKTVDELIKLWEKKQEQEFFWHFPEVQQIAARTLGIDLVSVQPMSAPIGNISYLDFQYNGNENQGL